MARIRKPRPKQSNYITPEGFERMREELAYLWNEERPRVTKAVAVAAAEGDRSENAEYIYGKKRLREIDARIQFITGRMEVVRVVEPGERTRADTVFFGAWVRIEDEDGDVKDYRVVGPDETDLHPHYISMDSPMGKALLKKQLDDEVRVRRPKGDLIVTVLEIQYEPFAERGDD